MENMSMTLEGKTVAVAGFGNVAWGVVQKLTELGASLLHFLARMDTSTIRTGITTKEKFDFMLEMRASWT